MDDLARLRDLLNAAQDEAHQVRALVYVLARNGQPPSLGTVTLLTVLQDAKDRLTQMVTANA